MHFSKLTVALKSILAAVHAAPTERSAREVIAANFGERTPAVTCGQFYKIEEEGAVPLYANGHYENLDVATHMIGLNNVSCGICIVFAGRDATGDILWSGGPGQSDGSKVRGGQSYYCISDHSVPATIGTVKNADVATRNTPATQQGCGQYFDNTQTGPIDLLANGHYENLASGTNMWSIQNISCGICIVFAGRDATGATMWSGGPGQGATVQVKGGQSYYCIYGDVPAPAGAQASTVDARRLH